MTPRTDSPDITEAALANEPIDRIEPQDPTEPMDRIEPVEPMDSRLFFDPMESRLPEDPRLQREGCGLMPSSWHGAYGCTPGGDGLVFN